MLAGNDQTEQWAVCFSIGTKALLRATSVVSGERNIPSTIPFCVAACVPGQGSPRRVGAFPPEPVRPPSGERALACQCRNAACGIPSPSMARADDIRMVRGHVSLGRRHIAQQREHIAQLERLESPIAKALEFLELLESTQELHELHLRGCWQRLLDESLSNDAARRRFGYRKTQAYG